MTARRSGGGDTLSLRALSRATLARQMLLGREAMKPVSAIERLVGLQAQWPRQAFIGLWTRLEGFRRDDLLGALSARKAVRVTAMRSTLHVMSAKDYVGMRAPLARALSKNLQAIVGKRLASVDLETVVSVAKAGFANDPQTFEEMRDRLVRRFPDGDERAMGYAARLSVPLVQVPTTDAWGFPASPQFVEAETWLGKPLRVDDDPAPIVSRYLAAFGPASIADVQSWSGLQGLREVFARLAPGLRTFTDERGRTLFDLPDAPRPAEASPAPVRFLPEFDNLLLAYDDRRRVIADAHKPAVYLPGLRVAPTLLVDGIVAGTWKIERKKDAATLSVTPFRPLPKAVVRETNEEAEALVRFAEPDATAWRVRVD
ncbi:MAG: winged helix DNA-binding domain-containing protein [Vicinamibacterales bacterium]